MCFIVQKITLNLYHQSKPEALWVFDILLSVLGQGSFGLVVLAQQASSQRQVAVKIFLEDSSDPFGTRRVTQEASIMQLLRHPNIVQLLEVGWVGHYHCLVMELVDGGDLYQHVMSRGGLPEPEAMVLFAQVLEAVGHSPEPVPVPAPSTPSLGSSQHLVVPEVPAAEPEEAGSSASASVPSKGRQGLGRRIGRSILRFLLRACCLPAPARGPGPRSRKVAPS
uniref:non-specific serine/threonine protein kinase n=1 Tax=Oryctolagus cuniculus TaxID=9986 RepID=A0A5F9CL45_RABIT